LCLEIAPQPLHHAHGRLLIAKPVQTINAWDYSLDIQAIFCGFGMKNSVVMHQKIILKLPNDSHGQLHTCPNKNLLEN
jgi:hypothetical protein